MSKQQGEHYWSVHYKNKCYITKNIDCQVNTESKVNKTQPYVVMRGFASELIEKEDLIIIK